MYIIAHALCNLFLTSMVFVTLLNIFIYSVNFYDTVVMLHLVHALLAQVWVFANYDWS